MSRSPSVLLFGLFGFLFAFGITPVKAQGFSNADLSRGTAIWKGDRKVQDDPVDASNKVLVVELQKDKRTSFYQAIDTEGAATLLLSFQVKPASDYYGEGIRISFTRPDGSSMWKEFAIEPDGWHEISWKFEDVNGARKLNVTIEVKPGLGKLFFDNFSIAPAL